ncbi:hypothetical protein [Methanolobus sp. WCC5]|uniref:hypothetical protein n=1 Tax=Methanolobus sp. WCC5 TaxID=3125785 RepID=UPI00324FA5E5
MTSPLFAEDPDTVYKNTVNKFCESIDHVKIVRGIVPSDPVTWEIHIHGGVVRIDSKKIRSQETFQNTYITEFNRPAPGFKKTDWFNFINHMSEVAEVVTSDEDTEHVYIAKQIIVEIRKLYMRGAEDDPEEAIATNRLLRKGEYLCIAGPTVEELIQSRNYHVAPNVLSKVMSDMGYKKPGTHQIRCGAHGRPYFWWFYESEISDSVDPTTTPENEIGGLVV